MEPIACTPSTTPLFQNSDPFDVLAVTLRANFDDVNRQPTKAEATSPGVLSYVDPISEAPVTVACSVGARGKSRFTYCGWRPIRLRFEGNPGGTLLDGTGKVIKVVTHCGFKPGDQWVLGGTPEEHTRRVMQEFALYQVLATLGSSSLATRLALIKYENPDGTTLDTQYGFFREREKRAAQRCGFKRLEFDEGDPGLPPNPTSNFQVHFHHRFIFSHDYSPQYEHNVIRIGSPSGQEYYIPYDFDLSGIIRPIYFKNNGWSIEENGEQLISWLTSGTNQDLVHAQVSSLLQHESEMRHCVNNGLVDATGKARLQEWFEDHIDRLKNY